MRRVRAWLLVCLLACLAPGWWRARASEAPATAPASASVDELVSRLGDPDFRVRRDATMRLRELGAAALPSLKQAAADRNPEIRQRANQLVRLMEYRHVPGRPRQHGRAQSVSVAIRDSQREVDVDDRGRRIRIIQGPAGIDMQVAGELDGRPAVERYKARGPGDLREQNPEAYALYQLWMTAIASDLDNGIGLQPIPGNNRAFRLQGAPAIRPLPAGGDHLEALRDQLDQKMRDAHFSPEQQKQVTDALDNVEQLSLLGALADDDVDARMKRYEDACDALRKTLNDLHLPDPGEALPPPRSARLGITGGNSLDAGGIVVTRVLPNSRADKLGLREDDVILKVNGKDVNDIHELRRTVTEHPKGLVVDVMRDGEQKRLEER